jgi:selenocysteine lyase/cysteine desulfurase
VYNTRAAAAEFFGAKAENTIFTLNCTMALNMAIKGIMQFGGHIIISDLEHNSVLRPVYALSKMRGVTFSVAHVYEDDGRTVEEIRKLIRSDTKCICCTVASNVTGRILPYREISSLCKSNGICFISDAAQAAGLLDISLADGFDFLCMPGHKALYAPSGTGLLISNGEYELSTIIEGGTGATSAEAQQTAFLPERLESGTVNTAGIIGLGKGIEFVRQKTPQRIYADEMNLCKRFEEGISGAKGVKLYVCKRRVPITSFNIGEINSQAVAAKLSDMGFALRGGLHCSALAHRALGTLEQGTVRFSPSVFNTVRQTEQLAAAVRFIAANAKSEK